MPASDKSQKAKASDKKGKYDPSDSRRSCSLCRTLHDGGVNELCPFAAPHTIANYCHSLKIPYPADLTKGKRIEHQAGPSQGAASQPASQGTLKPKSQTPKPPKKDTKGGKHAKLDPSTPARPQPPQFIQPPTPMRDTDPSTNSTGHAVRAIRPAPGRASHPIPPAARFTHSPHPHIRGILQRGNRGNPALHCQDSGRHPGKHTPRLRQDDAGHH